MIYKRSHFFSGSGRSLVLIEDLNKGDRQLNIALLIYKKGDRQLNIKFPYHEITSLILRKPSAFFMVSFLIWQSPDRLKRLQASYHRDFEDWNEFNRVNREQKMGSNSKNSEIDLGDRLKSEEAKNIKSTPLLTFDFRAAVVGQFLSTVQLLNEFHD